MREKIVAGNWKMNCGLAETDELLRDIKNGLEKKHEAVKIIVAPAFTNLYPAFQALRETPISVAAQNMHQNENGAFTGEVSAKMLKSTGVETVILGHSERRQYFLENGDVLSKKTDTALTHDLDIIFCVGEKLEERENESHFDVAKKQVQDGLFHLDKNAWKKITIAYEPVWAIGTGKTASAEQAQEMHAFIRKTIAETYGEPIAEDVSILYGGSVKPANAREIFAKKDVDGGLIGGASLKAKDFLSIVDSF